MPTTINKKVHRLDGRRIAKTEAIKVAKLLGMDAVGEALANKMFDNINSIRMWGLLREIIWDNWYREAREAEEAIKAKAAGKWWNIHQLAEVDFTTEAVPVLLSLWEKRQYLPKKVIKGMFRGVVNGAAVISVKGHDHRYPLVEWFGEVASRTPLMTEIYRCIFTKEGLTFRPIDRIHARHYHNDSLTFVKPAQHSSSWRPFPHAGEGI